MHLNFLGQDILLLYIIPHLLQKAVIALAATDKSLCHQLSFLRYPQCEMRSFMRPGSLVQSFRPSTLRQITHLVVNGTGVDQEEIFLSNLLTGVKSVTITRMIKPKYRHIFAHLARQLTELIEIGNQTTEDGRTSSLTLLPAGTLNTIETLSLHAVQLPPLQTLLLGPFGVDVSLTRFTFLPSQTGNISLAGNIPCTYIKDCLTALRILKEAAIFPSLKVVRLALGRSNDNNPMRKERVTLLNRIWAASAMHGGWRLLTRKPITDRNMGWITPWECGCETRNGALFLSVPEIESFAGFCDKSNIYGRWDEFVVGDVHVDVQSTRSGYLELKNPRSDTVRLADVHGVSILPGKVIDFWHVGSNTRCLSVQLRSFWDKRTNVEYNLNSNKFKNIEVLRLEVLPANQKQLATRHSRPPMYRNNLAAAITRNLHLPTWSSLRSLSLPAAAMQRFQENQDITKRAARCGRHIPEYHFPWSELCIQLDTLLITNWWTCIGCYEGKSNFQEEEDSQECREDVDHS